VDAACFNRKLDAHIAQRVALTPGLVMISDMPAATSETHILSRQKYVEVVAKKNKNDRDRRPERRPCNHLTPAIHTDGMDKGRLAKVCADLDCRIHFGDRHQEEKQRLAWIEERKAANRNAKQTIHLRHRILLEVLRRVRAPLGSEALRLVARFVLASLSHDLARRLAKRHSLQPSQKGQDWELAEKARSLHKTADATTLAFLIFEAMLLAAAASSTGTKDDLLAASARLYKVDVKTLRAAAAKAEKEKEAKKESAKLHKSKNGTKARADRR
jgi:ParB family chromosome partitioning protein